MVNILLQGAPHDRIVLQTHKVVRFNRENLGSSRRTDDRCFVLFNLLNKFENSKGCMSTHETQADLVDLLHVIFAIMNTIVPIHF